MKIRNIKKVVLLFLVGLSLSPFAACAYPQEARYQNFLADFDIVTRCDLCMDELARGDSSSYIVHELEFIQQDLESWDGTGEEILEINAYFLAGTDALLDASACLDAGMSAEYEVALSEAKEALDEANAAIIRVNRGLEYV